MVPSCLQPRQYLGATASAPATEVTLQPVDLIGVDAAIIFSDILVPVERMGLQLTVSEGEGPRIHNPVRSAAWPGV